MKKSSFPKTRRTQSRQRDKPRKEPSVEVPDRVKSRYLEEIKILDRCAELQGDHWTILGTETKLDLIKHFPFGSLRIAHEDGARYWHPEYDDPTCLFQFARRDRPEYPKHYSDKFYVGTQLNKILRHYIGREGQRETGKHSITCNEGGWVLLEDLLMLDFIWKDGKNYRWEEKNDRKEFLETRKTRIGLIVELTVAENRLKGKTRFQIMGLVAEDQKDLDAIKKYHKIPDSQAGTTPFGETYMVDGSCRSL